jgi:hypothetical protein
MPSPIQQRIANVQQVLKVSQTGIIDEATCTAIETQLKITSDTDLQQRKLNIQKALGFKGKDIDGIFGPGTLTALELCCTQLPTLPKGTSMIVSYKGLDLIINTEIGSKALYNKRYKFPVWPQGQSGVTIGIGYDLGYVTLSQFTKDWQDQLSNKDFNTLTTAVGKKGVAASAHLSASVKAVEIPLEVALHVFYTKSLPKYAQEVVRIYPTVSNLPPDAQAALLSLIYNRGASLAGDRRKEMKAIQPLVAKKDLKGIAQQLRAMKRLWGASLRGLLLRRDAEAALVEQGSYFVQPTDYLFV